MNEILIALITVIPTVLSVWLSYKSLHKVVNSRLDNALDRIKMLEQLLREERA